MTAWSQPRRLRALLLGALALASLSTAIFVALRRGDDAFGAPEVYRRAAPLIEAIERFHEDSGLLPGDLEDLVPGYLSGIPTTGTSADFAYWSDGVKWNLSASSLTYCAPDPNDPTDSGFWAIVCTF